MIGRLLAVVGPSGAGKDTLIAAAQAACPDLSVVRRVITRPETAGGEDFEGVTEDVFAARRATGEFALDWQAHGLSYGIRAAALTPLAQGRDVIFNGSRAALGVAKGRFPTLEVILITAADAVLAARLARRGRETTRDIVARLARAAEPLPEGVPCHVVNNDGHLDDGVARLLAVLQPTRG